MSRTSYIFHVVVGIIMKGPTVRLREECHDGKFLKKVFASMEILITFLKKMPILEPYRITIVVLKIYKVNNRIYHILKISQLTEFKIVLIKYYFPSLSPRNISEAILDQSLYWTLARAYCREYQISDKCTQYFYSRYF